MDELKPCPFCGGKTVMIEGGGNHPLRFWRPTCTNSTCAGFTFRQYNSRETALEKWNRRAAHAD